MQKITLAALLGLGLLTAEGEWRYGNMEESSTDEQFARMLISRVLGKALRGSFASNIDAAVAFMVQYALPPRHAQQRGARPRRAAGRSALA